MHIRVIHNVSIEINVFMGGLIILRDISIEEICRAKFKKGSLEMTKPLSYQKNINTNDIKTNKDIEIPMDSNIDLQKCYDNLLHNKETKKNSNIN